MYRTLTIENFRAFKRLHFDDLGRVNLIAGRNNSGKTSVLEAIALYSENFQLSILFRQYGDYEQNIRRIRRGSVNIETFFNDFKVSSPIVISADEIDRFTQLSLFEEPSGHSTLEMRLLVQEIDTLPESVFRDVSLIGRNRDFISSDELEVLEIRKNNVDGNVSYLLQSNDYFMVSGSRTRKDTSAFLHSRSHVSSRVNAERFSKLNLADQVNTLLQALRLIEPRLESLELLYLNRQPLIFGEIGLSKSVPISAMGDGMGRITSIILAMHQVKNGALLIDEIENGLHYSVLVELWRAIYDAALNFNVQIFATTHSYETIRAAHEAFSTSGEGYDFRLHRLDRDSQGDITAVTFNQDTLGAALDMNLEVR